MEPSEQNQSHSSGDATAELKEELRREHDMYLRALADFDNYRKRVERERGEVVRSANRELLRSLLDVVDNFDRALYHTAKAPSSTSEGMQLVQRQILALLEAHGVLPLKSLGERFNPELHEAIGMVESEVTAPGTVAEELQRGYLWGDELLRPARVRVAAGP